MYNLFQDVRTNKQFKKVKTQDLLLAEYTCEPGDVRSKLWSESHYFTFVTQGKLALSTLNDTYELTAGKAFFVQKGSCVFQLFKEEMYCELIIFVSDEHIKSVLNRHQISLRKDLIPSTSDLIIPLEMDDTLVRYRESLLAYFRQTQNLPAPLIQVKFEELLLNLLIHQHHAAFHQCMYEIHHSGRPSLSYIMEQNYCSDLALTEFARLCARSLSSFRRDFNKLYGIPPGQWLKEKRLQRSKVLLTNSDMTLEAICFECGFRNRSHFSRLFKERFGLSPQAFKKG